VAFHATLYFFACSTRSNARPAEVLDKLSIAHPCKLNAQKVVKGAGGKRKVAMMNWLENRLPWQQRIIWGSLPG